MERALMADRVHCCIPGCRRSFRAAAGYSDDEEVMCGRCWRSADPRLAARHKLMLKRSRKALKLLQRKSVQANPNYGARVERLYFMFTQACMKTFMAVKDDAAFKSAMRIEGTAGALAHRRAHAQDLPS